MQFRTKARAVDLLGKGQIADLPTAITELWKNGFDAYAEKLSAEIYLDSYKDLKKPMLLITDDGKGMSNNDILDKWLVLGTDSKSRTPEVEVESIETLWKKPRIRCGEKGIGRLSVSYLGYTFLMLTKKVGHPLQALFFDWRLLENYNLFLEDIIIPVAEIRDLEKLPKIFQNLKNDYLKNFDKETDVDGNEIWEKSQLRLKRSIIEDINNLSIPDFFIEEIASNLKDLKNDHGTKFIIFNPINQILKLSSKDIDQINDNDFVLKSLSGFTNEFKKGRKKIETSIPIHEEIGNDWDLLDSKGEFYNHKDFEIADVLIDGEFNGVGSFKGSIRMYKEYVEYQYNSPRKQLDKYNYGPIELRLGYVLGMEASSSLDSQKYEYITTKLKNKGGGLYIYRDDFRVLPYGRTDFDFINFERRRALSAGQYFFSHRRMFGYISISRGKNPNLKDKSSREGLINNAAFRAFKNDMESFFIDVAKEYFATKPKVSIFRDQQKVLSDQAKAIKNDIKRIANEKREFTNYLKKIPNLFNEYKNRYDNSLIDLETKLKQSNILYSEIEELLDEIQNLDIELNNLIPKVSKKYKLTDLQYSLLDKYDSKLRDFYETSKKQGENLLVKARNSLQVKELQIEFSKNHEIYLENLESIIGRQRKELNSKFMQLLHDFNSRSKNFINDFKHDKNTLIQSLSSKENVISETENIKKKFEFSRNQIENELLPLVEHLGKLSFDIDEDLVQGAYKAEYEAFKYQWEQTRETAQLGIAVEIIDHEFNHLYSKINKSLKNLNSIKYVNENKQFVFLRKNFKQLEDKYAQLSPLYRISGINKKNVSCVDLFEYLKLFFSNSIKENHVKLKATRAFLNHKLNIKEPVIHTVLINIVNNALFWIRNSEIKIIEFDYIKSTDELIIRNSGRKIEKHKLSKIFDLFYTDKPNGRGIGLYLSKQILNENFLDISATNDDKLNSLNGACFVIKPINQKV